MGQKSPKNGPHVYGGPDRLHEAQTLVKTIELEPYELILVNFTKVGNFNEAKLIFVGIG